VNNHQHVRVSLQPFLFVLLVLCLGVSIEFKLFPLVSDSLVVNHWFGNS
jgi:hypothetical protein